MKMKIIKIIKTSGKKNAFINKTSKRGAFIRK